MVNFFAFVLLDNYAKRIFEILNFYAEIMPVFRRFFLRILTFYFDYAILYSSIFIYFYGDCVL
jgi:hypothetical protein